MANGVDIHMFGLISEYPEIARSAMEKATAVDIDAQLDVHSSGRYSLNFSEDQVSHIRGFFDDRKESMHKIMTL